MKHSTGGGGGGGRVAGVSPNIQVVGVPVGNFHDKP